MFARFLLLTAPLALAACGGSSANGTAMIEDVTVTTAFETPDAAGSFATDLVESDLTNRVTRDGNGFAYEVGTSNTGIVARAGLLPNILVSSPPTTASVLMPSRISAQSLTDAAAVDGVVQGDTLTSVSLITLTADFDTGTLTGKASLEGSPDIFVVDGRMADSLLSGTVTYNGISGPLSGVVGADEAIGVFHGASDDAVMAGGFLKFEPTP